MIDLHFHSSCSEDATLSPKEWAERVAKSNLSFCSLTDHDSVSGLELISKKLASTGVKFINGVELSAIYKNQEIHILAYDFDSNKAEKIITERNELVQKQKQTELSQAIYLFKKEGFNVGDKLKSDDKKPVGLIVALDVYYNSDNQKKLIKKHGHLLNHD